MKIPDRLSAFEAMELLKELEKYEPSLLIDRQREEIMRALSRGRDWRYVKKGFENLGYKFK